jgi:hypothetical protein
MFSDDNVNRPEGDMFSDDHVNRPEGLHVLE